MCCLHKFKEVLAGALKSILHPKEFLAENSDTINFKNGLKGFTLIILVNFIVKLFAELLAGLLEVTQYWSQNTLDNSILVKNLVLIPSGNFIAFPATVIAGGIALLIVDYILSWILGLRSNRELFKKYIGVVLPIQAFCLFGRTVILVVLSLIAIALKTIGILLGNQTIVQTIENFLAEKFIIVHLTFTGLSILLIFGYAIVYALKMKNQDSSSS